MVTIGDIATGQEVGIEIIEVRGILVLCVTRNNSGTRYIKFIYIIL